MPLIWRRRSPRLYKTISSTSSSDDDDTSSYSSASGGSSHNSEPEPQPQQDLEVDQSQAMEVSDSDSDISYGDHELKYRELLRRKGDIKRPRFQWEIMSIEYCKWCKRMERFGPEPETENLAMLEPSPGITLPLLKFQKEWLVWGLNQEASELRGGILADEMGMGKTIQAISLVVTTRDMCARSEASSSSSRGNNKCTLVICPLVALIQWEKEIEKYTVEGSVKVLVFHGAKRPKGEVDFSGYDFVLTTYSTVESDYRKYVMPPKVVCQYCGRGFFSIKTLNTHLREFCGPNAKETSMHFKNQTKGKGKMKSKALTDPLGILGISPLHSVRWERIILDEAHVIKDRRSNTAKAVFHLESQYKWALSGTPLQNRVGELYSLIRYLQIFPYSYYMCKDCDCSVLDFFPGHCANCDHATSRHFCWWNKYIVKPIQEYSDTKYGQRAMLLLREKVLKSVLLRRTKSSRAADFVYPPKFVKLRRDSLDEFEEEFYVAMYTQSHTKFNSYVEAGTLMNHYAHIFDMLIRLRQALDHPYLVLYPSRPEACGLCHSKANESVITSCEHAFCKSCWEDHLATTGSPLCPTCQAKLALGPSRKPRRTSKVKGFRSTSILNRLDLSNFKTSSKIEALKEEIRNMLEEDGSAKGIVFSQFASFLDLIGYSLNKVGIKWVQLNGSMNIDERDKAITEFADDADCKILLMSLKAGGVALNLVVASYVFLMDPWWNPAAEKQAQDRIHRIGQHKPIRVIRFVIENTVEERILSLQDKKELVFDGTVGKSPEALARLTVKDLQFLFTS